MEIPRLSVAPTAVSSFFWPGLLISLGLFGVGLPVVTSLAVLRVIGWLAMLSGITQIVYALHSNVIGSIVWKICVAVLYVAVGIHLLQHPALNVGGLAIAIAMFFVAEGLLDFAAYIDNRKFSASTWILFNVFTTLFLAWMIVNHWPSSSFRVLGTLVGLNILAIGITRVMMTLHGSSLLDAHAK